MLDGEYYRILFFKQKISFKFHFIYSTSIDLLLFPKWWQNVFWWTSLATHFYVPTTTVEDHCNLVLYSDGNIEDKVMKELRRKKRKDCSRTYQKPWTHHCWFIVLYLYWGYFFLSYLSYLVFWMLISFKWVGIPITLSS